MNSKRWLHLWMTVPLMVLAGCGQRGAAPQNTNAAPRSAAVSPTSSATAKHKGHLESGTSPNRTHRYTESLAVKKEHNSTPWANFNVPILEYHDTVSIPGDPYTMSPAQLDQEMAFLKSHGFHTVTLDAVYDSIHHKRPLPSRPIVLTFDDGYESNYTTATPVLRKYGFVATEFMVSGFMNKSGFLTASQLQEMKDSGVWEIESHTKSHPDLTRVNPSSLWNQVSQPKAVLSQAVGGPINYFCYPFGSYNGNVIRDVKRAGYLLAVCTEQGYANPATDGPFVLNRIAIHQGLTINAFSNLLSRSFR